MILVWSGQNLEAELNTMNQDEGVICQDGWVICQDEGVILTGGRYRAARAAKKHLPCAE